MDPTDLITLLFTLGSSAAVLARPIAALRPRRHLRCIDARIACPRTGADVDCSLLRDDCTGAYTRVEACSASGAGHRPDCDQDCVWILNLGIPLLPSEAARAPKAPDDTPDDSPAP